MLRRAAVFALLAGILAGCNRPLVLEDYYRKPNIENVTDFTGFERVVATADKDRVVGYVEHQTVSVKGYRDVRDQHFVYDTHLVRIGFMTHMGATYKYMPDQSEEFIGNFTVADGARALLRYDGEVKIKPYDDAR